MSLNCISSVLIPTASRGKGKPFFSQPTLQSVTAASSMLTKCKCQPSAMGPGAGAPALSPQTFKVKGHRVAGDRFWHLQLQKWKENMMAGLRENEFCVRVGNYSLLYDIITQYTVVFSSSATENTGLARLSDTLLIYRSKEKCFSEVLPWFKAMPITTVAAPLRQKFHLRR